MRPKPLPKVVFVHRKNEGEKDEYIVADETLEDAAALHETKRVGRYVLFEEMDVSTTVIRTIVKRPGKKRAAKGGA